MPNEEAQVTQTEVTPPVEAPAEDTPPEVEEDAATGDEPEEEAPELDDYEKRMAKLMAQSRDNFRAKQALKEQEAKLQRAEYLERLAKENPEALLRELGATQPKLDLDAILGPKEEPAEVKAVKEMRQTVEALQGEINELKGAAKQRAEAEQQRAFEAWSADEKHKIEAHITEKTEDYQLLNAMKELGVKNDVFQFMMDHYAKTGDALTYEQAAGVIESYWDRALKHLVKTEKAKALLGVPQATGKNGKPATKKTLTNNMSAESPTEINPDDLSEEENRKYALAQAVAAQERAQAQLKS